MATSLADSTDEFDDYRCPHCGAAAEAIEHIEVPVNRVNRKSSAAALVEGKKAVWRNRCKACGYLTEYVPTRADIQREAAAIQAENRTILGVREFHADD